MDMARAYAQHCGLAHALDLVGERWTLLIVRELLAGPRRYTDLKDGLISIPTNVLASRLREMESGGLIQRRRLPPPASSVVVYELTPDGESLTSAVTELARWGMRTLPPIQGRPLRAHWLVLALQASFDPTAAEGVKETYEFTIESDDVVSFDVTDGEGQARMGAARDAAVRIKADADTLAGLMAGELEGAEALRRGALVDGSASAITRMRQVLPHRRREPTPIGVADV